MSLLERETELAAIEACVDDVEAGRGSVLVIEGPAGAGKSSLLAAARERTRARGVLALHASGGEFERDLPHGVVRMLFEPALLAAPEDRRSALLAGAAAPAAAIVAPTLNGAGDAPAAEPGFAVLNALYWLAANLAAERPLALLVDDLHWADPASLRALAHLGRRLGDLPLAVVGAVRSGEPDAPAALLEGIARAPGATRLAPRPLSAAAVAQMVRRRLPDADDELCAAYATTTGGNPHYLQELLRGDGAGEGVAVTETSLPDLAEGVERRVERIAPGATDLARAMAALGDGAALRDAAAVAGLEEAEAAAIAQRLVRMEVLADADPFRFVHPLVRRSLHDGLTVTERDALHRRAADVLAERGASADAVASHLLLVRPAGSAEVAAALHRAAVEGPARAAPDAAARLLERALEEEAPAPPRPALLRDLGRAQLALRDPAAAATLGEALATETDPEARAGTAVLLAELLAHAGQWEQLAAFLDQVRPALDESSPAFVGVEGTYAALLAFDPARVETFEAERPRFERLAAGETWGAEALEALLGAIDAYRGEDVEQSRARLTGIAERGVLVGEREGGSWAGPIMAAGLFCLDEWDTLDALAEQLGEQGRRTGALFPQGFAVLTRAQTSIRGGDLRGAEADVGTLLTIATESGMQMWLTSVLFVVLDALLERPALAEVAGLADAVTLDEAFSATTSGAALLEVRARLALARGDRAQAIADLRTAGETYAPLRFGPTWTQWRSALALALGPDARDEARGLAEQELALARATGLARPEGVALRAAGLVVEREEGIDLLRASVARLEEGGLRLEQARSLVELGAALRRAGQRADGREPLEAGLDLAHRCGAERLAERAEQELRATGARPRRRVVKGLEALTASELRIAQLAAAGRGNPDIAQELFLSVKTVEAHLSSVYAKLGLGGQGARRRLGDALRAPD